MVEVVAALIWDKDKFLICQRPKNKAKALLWEFVGGKVEQGETLFRIHSMNSIDFGYANTAVDGNNGYVIAHH